jgi:hypothetical protein
MIHWPPNSKIVCFNSDEKVIAESKRSKLDLADSLMSCRDSLTAYIDVAVLPRRSLGSIARWKSWNTENVQKIERHIEYDLTFDGYKVAIERVTKPGKLLCSNPFRWRIEINPDFGSEEGRSLAGKRFRAARSDASVKSVTGTIEDVFGLPKGSVALLSPEGDQAATAMKIRTLRNKWKRYA